MYDRQTAPHLCGGKARCWVGPVLASESIIPALFTFRSDSDMSGRDFEETVKEEETRLRAVHPTAEDVPGCMALLDDFLSCNSPCLSRVPK